MGSKVGEVGGLDGSACGGGRMGFSRSRVEGGEPRGRGQCGGTANESCVCVCTCV